MDRPARRALDDSRHETAQEQPAPAPAPSLGISNHALAALLSRDATKEKPKETKPAEATGSRVVFPKLTVPIESMQWGSGNAGNPGRGHDRPSEIVFTSKMGAHSSELMRRSVEGEAVDVEVFFGSMKFKLKGAMISSYTTASGGEQEPLEMWTMTFHGIELEGQKSDEEQRPDWDRYPGG